MSFNKSSRVVNSRKNIAYGMVGKVSQLFLKFLLRTVIIYSFGAVYLGLDGLFLNVISVLAIAELGIGNAICFALYKPLAESDEYKVSAYIILFKKVYVICGGIVLLLGLLCLPVLDIIIKFDSNVSVNYYIIYLFFLLNTVISYWFGAYYQVLFTADQKDYQVNNIKNIVMAVTILLQIALIFLTNNYYVYLAIMVLGTIVTNLFVVYWVNREYPGIVKRKDAVLSKQDRTALKKNVMALFITKISTVIYTSSDNIVISSIIGTIVVGYYSNYSYIVSALTGIIAIIFSGVLASVGNVNVTESDYRVQSVYKKMLFINCVIYGFCFVCIHNLISDFVLLWAGSEYLLDHVTTTVIALLFFLPGLNHTNTIFKDASGLFWEMRYRPLATAAINIALSFLLAGRLGLMGVFLATIISYFATTFIVDPKVIFNKTLHCDRGLFYKWYLCSCIKVFAIDGLAVMVTRNITVNSVGEFIFKSIIIVIVAAGCLLITEFRKEEFRYYIELLFRRKHI